MRESTQSVPYIGNLVIPPEPWANESPDGHWWLVGRWPGNHKIHAFALPDLDDPDDPPIDSDIRGILGGFSERWWPRTAACVFARWVGEAKEIYRRER